MDHVERVINLGRVDHRGQFRVIDNGLGRCDIPPRAAKTRRKPTASAAQTRFKALSARTQFFVQLLAQRLDLAMKSFWINHLHPSTYDPIRVANPAQ